MKTLRKLWQLATRLLAVMPEMARATTTNDTANTDQRLKQRKSGVHLALLLVLSVLFALLVTTPGVLAASGDFSIEFVTAAPQSYNHLTGGGAYDDSTIGVDADIVKSLVGGDFSCGDIVTFFATVTVGDTTQADTDAPQTIELNVSFLAVTTGQSGVALGDIVLVQVNYGTIEDLIAGENSVDDGIDDDGGSTATLTYEHLTGPLFQAGSELHGTVKLDDLERNEKVVVRIDVKLFGDPGSAPTGNLAGALPAARLTFINGAEPVDPPEAISVGQQTVPFKQIGDICFPELNIEKTVNTSNGTCPGVETLTIYAGETVKYCYVVTNPSSCAPLYNVKLVDDNSTPGDTGDDFTVTLLGLTDVDGDGTADDLNASGTAYGNVTVTINRAGTVTNNATATGDDSIIEPTTLIAFDTAEVIANVAPNPQYSINKTITGADTAGDSIINNAGEIIDYEIVVTNDGNVDLTGV
ncbi:MAG: internalin, partial [Euryarchaeota archaeon]|nr:internalin [Euryarchaeota archaeon]